MATSKAYERIKTDVLGVVADIPVGRVTTYGAIAQALGIGPRQVASVLANDPDAADVPWHRVVAAGGRLSIPDHDGQFEQARRLREEGVAVVESRIGRFGTVFYAP